MRVLLVILTATFSFWASAAFADMSACDAASRSKSPDEQISLYTICLRTAPYKTDRAGAYNNRGLAYIAKGDLDSALSDFTASIENDPSFAVAYMNRAKINVARRHFDLAEADLDKAVRLPPGRVRAQAYEMRGMVRSVRGNYSGAVADFEQAISFDKKLDNAYTQAARILATCPDAKVRDGAKAVTLALKAVELNDTAETEDVLAAAYAEAGRFDDAVRTETSAIAKAGGAATPAMTARLTLYQAGKPYREGGASPDVE